jgi:Ion channel
MAKFDTVGKFRRFSTRSTYTNSVTKIPQTAQSIVVRTGDVTPCSCGGGCLSILEPQTVKGGYGDGIWWAIVTASTVGYGDISPSTPAGRLIAVALMLVGIGLMSTLAASITAHFVQETENAQLREVCTRLERIETLLGERQFDQHRTVSSSDER